MMQPRRTKAQRAEDAEGAFAAWDRSAMKGTVWFKFDAMSLAVLAERLKMTPKEAFLALGGEAYGIAINFPEG